MAKASRRKAKAAAADKAGAGPRGPAARTEGPEQVVDIALRLFAERGWRNVALADIAAACGLSLAQLYALFPSKLAILDAFERRINEQTLATAADSAEPVRDRLFELIMRRLDALAPHKAAVRALATAAAADPALVLATGPRFLNAMRWMAEAAGIDTSGLGGALRVKGVAAVYLATLRAWIDDDSADGARTMAALDRALKRAEMVARSLPGFVRRAA